MVVISAHVWMAMNLLKGPTIVQVRHFFMYTLILYNQFWKTDVDECAGINDCQQVCINTVGSFTCNCFDGFTFTSDGRNCTGIKLTLNGSKFLLCLKYIVLCSNH